MEDASKIRPTTSGLAGDRGVSSEDFRAIVHSLRKPRILTIQIGYPQPLWFVAYRKMFWRRRRALLNCLLLMTQRDIPTPATSTRTTVKLITCQDGEHKHYLKP